jgi:hypothetical protein
MPNSSSKDDPPPISFQDFLQSVPVALSRTISDLVVVTESGPDELLEPHLKLFCTSSHCNGERFFSAISDTHSISNGKSQNVFMRYSCRNCGELTKTYALRIKSKGQGEPQGVAYKFGEIPVFGPPIPSRLITLIGPNRDLFLQGFKAEKSGLGIGAFAYYRRVVENQWSRIVGEVIKVAERIDADKGLIGELSKVATETQFKKAVDNFPAIPQVLLIDGHHTPSRCSTGL